MQTLAPSDTTLTIDPRFRGPGWFGNGGYVCGRLARFVDGPAEVTLRRPTPLARPLTVHPDREAVRLQDGETLLAEARPGTASIDPPPPVSFGTATRVAVDPDDLADHPFPGCFVCGPDRQDGLRIFPGELGEGLIAGPWVPGQELADGDSRIAPWSVWAALDCPSGWSTAALVAPGTVALLGRLSVAVHELPTRGSPCVLVACADGRERRKLLARSALYAASGHLLAAAAATWIVAGPSR